MQAETKTIIKVNRTDCAVMNEFLQMLDTSPIELSDLDYVDIMRSIASLGDYESRVEEIEIQYE